MSAWDGTSELQSLCRIWAQEQGATFYAQVMSMLSEETRNAYLELDADPKKMGDLARRSLEGPAFWVAPDMATLVEGASESMPPEPLHSDDPFAAEGWCLWPHQLPIIESDGDEWPVLKGKSYRAVSWVVDRGILWYMRWFRPSENGIPGLEPFLASVPFPWEVERDYDYADERDVQRLLKAFWAIVSQPVPGEIVERHASRSEQRRAAREARVVDPVRVIQLRRRAESHAESADSHVEWSHRWVVSGHWRNQWLPSRESHRLQYIAPYVKGPDDKPFVPKKVIYRVDR